MGQCSSSSSTESHTRRGGGVESYGEDDDFALAKFQRQLQRNVALSLQVQVAHFTPASFPIIPVIDKRTNKLCEESWNKLISKDVVDESADNAGATISGMTAFYQDFYDRLDQVDTSGRFEAILSRHSSGDKVAAKGAILLRIIKFVLRIDEDSKQNQLALYMLGKSHSQKLIRPWQYSVFVQTLLNTIASRLGTDATNDVMEAWVNLFAYVVKSMLPAAIKDQVVETEVSINTSSEFDTGRVAEEVAEMEEVKEVRKKMMKGSQYSGSRYGASAQPSARSAVSGFGGFGSGSVSGRGPSPDLEEMLRRRGVDPTNPGGFRLTGDLTNVVLPRDGSPKVSRQ
jgi:hemoglobin-like flavoprotein